MNASRLTQDEINARVLSSDQPSDRIGARTMRGGAIAVASQIVRTGLQILSVAILARLLAPEHFGLIAMGGTVMALVGVLTELNVTTATIQRDHLDQNTVSGIFFINIGMALAAVALSLVAIPAAEWVFKDERVRLIVIGLAAASPVYALGSQHQALLMRNMKWLDVHIVSLGGFAIGAIVAVVAAWQFQAGYWALVVQAWATAAATSALAWLRCPWRPTWVSDWTGARGSLKFGLNLSAAMFLNYINRQLDSVLIGWRWGSVELGYYSRAYTLLQTPLNFLTGPLGSAMVPAMSRLQSEPAKWRMAYLDALGVITIIGAAMACLLYGGAGPIIEIVLGDNWGETKLIFSNLVIAMLAATPMRTTGWIYISTGRTDRMFQWGLIGTPMYVAAFFIGLPYGAAALAFCFSISQLLAFLPCMWMATRGTNITMSDVLGVVAVPTLAAVGVGWALHAAADALDLLQGVAAITVAGLAYLLIVAAAVWYLPIYRRLRDRALDMVNKAMASRSLRPGN